MKISFSVFGVALAAFALSACSHLPELPSVGGVGTASDATPRERVRMAIDLLGQGEARRARAELRAALEEQPSNTTARRLMEQLDTEPRALLGGNARPYTVRAGESMSQIAERFLGDGLLFYALARYNNIEAPNQVSAGQTLMVPHRPGVIVREAAARDVAPVEPPVAAVSPSAATRASQLRLQALQQLNSGQVDAAVALLRQARALDSANPAIRRDLDRAERLQASLRTRGG